jgi:hypothetical protein
MNLLDTTPGGYIIKKAPFPIGGLFIMRYGNYQVDRADRFQVFVAVQT